ncbi:hypothetical protein H0H81_010246 [Sphagnurus paluster]|uniref:Uncharacterized protein n=1 Tax=Sphagnurus paluster TaxID=117069 RepID=A0A9P7GPD6_9AGAR|nr:hypothetical protein H0H81_010246 [Sphagnurus paluster]
MPRNSAKKTTSPSPDQDAQGRRQVETRSSMRIAERERRALRAATPESTVPDGPKLHAPLTAFLVRPPNTHLTRKEYLDEKERFAWKYNAGYEVELGSNTWIQLDVTTPSGLEGHLWMPVRFHRLWRRLQWAIAFFEKMWGLWEEEASRITTAPPTTPREEAIELGRRCSAMRLMSYLRFRRLILEQLIALNIDTWSEDLDDPNQALSYFIEFGVRDYRSWMFDSFETAWEEEEHFLSLDPTASENLEAFDKDGNSPFLNNPPPGDDWLNSPWALPYGLTNEVFMERVIVGAMEVPPEPIPMDDEEGADYMQPYCRIWEFQRPKVYPYSNHYLEFFRENALVPDMIAEQMQTLNMRPLTPWRDDRDNTPLPGVRTDADSDDIDRKEILKRLEVVLEPLRNPDTDIPIQDVQKALAEILGSEYGDIISTLIDNSTADPDGNFAPGAEAAVEAAVQSWVTAQGNKDAEGVPDVEFEDDVDMTADAPADPSSDDELTDMDTSEDDKPNAMAVDQVVAREDEGHILGSEGKVTDASDGSLTQSSMGATGHNQAAHTEELEMHSSGPVVQPGVVFEARKVASVPQPAESRQESSPSDFDMEHLLLATSPGASSPSQGNEKQSIPAERTNEPLLEPLTAQQKDAWKSHWEALIPIILSAADEVELNSFINWVAAAAPLCKNYEEAAELGSSVFADSEKISERDRPIVVKNLCMVLDHCDKNGFKIPISANTMLLNDFHSALLLECTGDILGPLGESWGIAP